MYFHSRRCALQALLCCLAIPAWTESFPVIVANDSEEEMTLATGDEVVLTFRQFGIATTEVNCGPWRPPFLVWPGLRVRAGFTEAGLYQLKVHNLFTAKTEQVTCHVASVRFPPHAAIEIGLRRELHVTAVLAGGDVHFASSDPDQLRVEVLATSDGTVDLAVTPLAPGDGAIVAIARKPSGPAIISSLAVDEFTITSHLAGGFIYHVDEDGFSHGDFGFTMSPKIPYLDVVVDIFVPTMSVDGQTYFVVHGADLEEDGSWQREFVMVPGSANSCHRFFVIEP